MATDHVFVTHVSDAYKHLYDIVYLRRHPLTGSLTLHAGHGAEERAWALHHLLLDVIERLDPGPQAPPFSHAWRRHRLLALRYVDGLDPRAVADRLAISLRSYYREHLGAMEAAAALLQGDRPLQGGETESPREMPVASGRLELLRLEAAHVAQANQRASLVEVVDSAVHLVKELAEGHGVRICAHVRDLPESLGMDRNTLKQILLGVLSHLLGSLRDGAIRIRTGQEGEQLALSLTGEGAWSEGRQADASQAELRMSLLDELATMQGARIVPVTDCGAITGFRLLLPTAASRTVLLIDDNEDALQLFQRYLAHTDYRGITATTGSEGLSLAGAVHPYAITLDLMMPDQDGWDVLQALSNRPETMQIPVIVCTVLSCKELALSLGATLFLEKPVTQQAFLSALGALQEEAQGRSLA